MERRQGWLFPLMVAAASTVTVFSCLGIAAIMGVLPLSSARLVAQVDMVEAQTAKAAAATAQPGRGGR
jgi:hypothetical protein